MNSTAAEKGTFTVEQGRSLGPDLGILTISRTITQGNYNLHYQPVTGFVVNLPIDLYWGNPSNSLRLMVYSPGNVYSFGPFYDNYDGSINGRTQVNINNPGGIPQGTWTFEVYGYSVTGTQSYTI